VEEICEVMFGFLTRLGLPSESVKQLLNLLRILIKTGAAVIPNIMS
jgi:hypothetical protein